MKFENHLNFNYRRDISPVGYQDGNRRNTRNTRKADRISILGMAALWGRHRNIHLVLAAEPQGCDNAVSIY
jgi:hypothetical protein